MLGGKKALQLENERLRAHMDARERYIRELENRVHAVENINLSLQLELNQYKKEPSYFG